MVSVPLSSVNRPCSSRGSDLRTGELAAWEATLPPRFRHDVVRALRQVLDAAVAWEYLPRNPAKATGKNVRPAVVERIALEPADVDRLAAELRSPHDVAAIVGAWTYLRPSELLALERAEIDPAGGILHVRRTLDGEGGTKASGKTRRSLRSVPLPLRARLALSELPPRLSTPASSSRLPHAGRTTSATGAAGSSSGAGTPQGSTRP